ncbi:hypothetical protein BC940DRAFT_324119 [Gongronella butleri]|nr:hypothetical protein BC940DRAFT_324119 [Gongronella butleri]
MKQWLNTVKALVVWGYRFEFLARIAVIIAALRGGGDPKHPAAQEEFKVIVENVESRRAEGEPGYLSMLYKVDHLNIPRRVHLSIWLQIIQEGIGIITVYAPKIFQVAGFSSSTSQLLSGLNDVSYMLSTLIAVFTLDKYSLLLMGILIKPEIFNMNPLGCGIGATVFTFVYTAFFGTTWLTVPWLYPTEIYPTKVRAKGGAWSVVSWSIGNALVMEITPPAIANIGWLTFIIFAIFNAVSIPIIWPFYSETAGRTLEELDVLFSTKSPFVWQCEKEFAEKNAFTASDSEENDQLTIKRRKTHLALAIRVL